MEKQIAIIRLRGRTGLKFDIANTLRLLRLERINTCLVVNETPQLLGMLRKSKDYITWGYIADDVLKELIQKRRKKGEERLFFRLNPAKGGLGSRGIKASFSNSGALGDRKEKINDLLRKMM